MTAEIRGRKKAPAKVPSHISIFLFFFLFFRDAKDFLERIRRASGVERELEDGRYQIES